MTTMHATEYRLRMMDEILLQMQQHLNDIAELLKNLKKEHEDGSTQR